MIQIDIDGSRIPVTRDAITRIPCFGAAKATEQKKNGAALDTILVKNAKTDDW